MAEMNEWATAPQDGSEIGVEFPDGKTAKAKWSFRNQRWEVQRSNGDWVGMQFDRGRSKPTVWWS